METSNEHLPRLRVPARRTRGRGQPRSQAQPAAAARRPRLDRRHFLTAATVTAATNLPWWQSGAPAVNPKVVDRQLAPNIRASFPPSADGSRARTVAEWD